MAPKLNQVTVLKAETIKKDQMKNQNLLRLSKSKIFSTNYYHRLESFVMQE